MSKTKESAAAEGIAGRKRATPRSRRREQPAPVAVDAPPDLAGFRAVAPGPAAVQMWPLESGTWLQPEFCIAVPRFAGIRIERRSRVAGPTFARVEAVPARGRAALHPISDQPPAPVKVILPLGDIRPLGWGARTILRSNGQV